MQKWWLVGAGVVGVGLAVLLLGKPFDTGEDVGALNTPDVNLPEPVQMGDEGLIRGAAGVRDASGVGRVTEATAGNPGTGSSSGSATTIEGEEAPSRYGGNPLARRADARRDVPEARYASRVMAPWTEVRRQLAANGGDNESTRALADEIDGMLEDMKQLRREPSEIDFEALRATEVRLLEQVAGNPHANDEVRTMTGLITERYGDYETELSQ